MTHNAGCAYAFTEASAADCQLTVLMENLRSNLFVWKHSVPSSFSTLGNSHSQQQSHYLSGNVSAFVILPCYFPSTLSKRVALSPFAFEEWLNLLSPDSREDISFSKTLSDGSGAAVWIKCLAHGHSFSVSECAAPSKAYCRTGMKKQNYCEDQERAASWCSVSHSSCFSSFSLNSILLILHTQLGCCCCCCCLQNTHNRSSFNRKQMLGELSLSF